MIGVERWIEHSEMSGLAAQDRRLSGLPSEIDALNRVIQGLLIHSEWVTAYGLEEKSFEGASRQTLPVATRLDAILAADARKLTVPRSPGRREVGTCRDFALMLCAILRGQGIPSRVRCGFAAYFHEDWEDHWVCEYWDRSAGLWRLSDARLDGIIAGKCNVSFDPADVPRAAFVTADVAWRGCRSGRFDPGRFGHGETKGSWFLKVNAVRDHYAINNREVSAWDNWRATPRSARAVTDREAAWLDDLAAFPERALAEIAPDREVGSGDADR